MSKNTQLGNLVNGIFVDSTGRVGVGTQTPVGKFNIVDGTNKSLIFQDSGIADTFEVAAYSASGGTRNLQINAANLIFGTGTSGGSSSTERMRIASDGTKYFGTYNTSRMQIDAPGESIRSYTNNYYIYSLFNDSNSLSIESAFAGNIIFRAQAQGTSSSPGTAAERMRITSGGNVGIGTTSAGTRLTISDTNGPKILLTGGSSQNGISFASHGSAGGNAPEFYLYNGNTNSAPGFSLYDVTNSAWRFIITNGGNLLLGTTVDNGYRLFVNGTSAGTSAFQNVSDVRLKKDINPIKNGLDKVNKLNGISFNWNKDLRDDLNLDDNNHLGLIAQDVEKILPQVVSTGSDELQTKTIAYSDIVPVLIEAIKELSAEIETLKQK
jgi:hypothetical protein